MLWTSFWWKLRRLFPPDLELKKNQKLRSRRTVFCDETYNTIDGGHTHAVSQSMRMQLTTPKACHTLLQMHPHSMHCLTALRCIVLEINRIILDPSQSPTTRSHSHTHYNQHHTLQGQDKTMEGWMMDGWWMDDGWIEQHDVEHNNMIREKQQQQKTNVSINTHIHVYWHRIRIPFLLCWNLLSFWARLLPSVTWCVRCADLSPITLVIVFVIMFNVWLS